MRLLYDNLISLGLLPKLQVWNPIKFDIYIYIFFNEVYEKGFSEHDGFSYAIISNYQIKEIAFFKVYFCPLK